MDVCFHDSNMKILYLSAEVSPLAKAGGLADVAGSLPSALHALGHDVRVVMPAYGFIDHTRFALQPILDRVRLSFAGGAGDAAILQGTIGDGTPLYLVDQPAYFDRDNIYGYDDDAERFLFFCRGALEAARALGWRPDVVHGNDWHTGAVPLWLSTASQSDPLYAETATVHTIHNLAYQGVFPASVWRMTGEQAPTLTATVNFMALGIRHADVVTTVSPTYAREILTPDRGEGLEHLLATRHDRLRGILNGLDTAAFDPATDSALVQRFDADHLEARQTNKSALQTEAGLPVGDQFALGMVSRLASQKGFDILIAALDRLIPETDAQFVLLGTGDREYANRLRALARQYPQQVAVFLSFDSILAQHIYAGCDAFLMPSRYEPCGLGQLIALRYGAVPIVRATGGLIDTVRDFDEAAGNGFVFRAYDAEAFLGAIHRAHEAYRNPGNWHALQQRGMREDFSWDASASQYVAAYAEAIEASHGSAESAPIP